MLTPRPPALCTLVAHMAPTRQARDHLEGVALTFVNLEVPPPSCPVSGFPASLFFFPLSPSARAALPVLSRRPLQLHLPHGALAQQRAEAG